MRSRTFSGRFARAAGSCLLLALIGLAPALADERPPAMPQGVEQQTQLVDVSSQLQNINQSLSEIQTRVDRLRRELASAQDEARQEELRARLTQLEAQRRTLRATFQRVALGGMDLSAFEERQEQQEFNWQNELLSILRPLFYELRQLTEQPRAMEQLRSERALINQRLQSAAQALANIEAIPREGLDQAAAGRLSELEQHWRDRRAQLEQQRAVVQLQLDNLQQQDVSIYEQVRQAAREFLLGRGLTLAAAMLAFAFVLALLLGVSNRWLHYRNRRGGALPAKGRILLLVFRMFSAFAAVMVFLMVLYAAGDAVLLALSLVVLIALLLSFRTYLPRYVTEAKLFLNAGQVREKERVVYQGIPWEVSSIGLFAKLSNPELENGILRLPLKELDGLISRPVAASEPWFPSRPGEFVLLSDETFGMVVRQTPELVELRVRNSSVMYATAEFISLRPRNLSRGSYMVAVTFGIDYRHQPIATREVPAIFNAAITTRLAEAAVAEHIEAVQVDFSAAGSSSLDYLILVTVNGAAADSYFKLGRMVQGVCVDVCNAQGWVIPFNQLTIHQGDGFAMLNVPRRSTAPEPEPEPA
jgi:hypothetical protein